LQGSRERDGSLFLGKAYADAQALKEAGVSRLGTDECKLIEIFTTRNFSQLRFTFKKYKEVSPTNACCRWSALLTVG